jgi:hypothetical protein
MTALAASVFVTGIYILMKKRSGIRETWEMILMVSTVTDRRYSLETKVTLGLIFNEISSKQRK